MTTLYIGVTTNLARRIWEHRSPAIPVAHVVPAQAGTQGTHDQAATMIECCTKPPIHA